MPSLDLRMPQSLTKVLEFRISWSDEDIFGGYDHTSIAAMFYSSNDVAKGAMAL